MTNAEHTTLRANLTKWSIEDLNMVKSLVEVELMERDCAKPEFREWMNRLVEELNQPQPNHLRLVK